MISLSFIADNRPFERSCLVRGTYRVKVLPRHDPVEMSRNASAHLVRLYRAYSWAVKSPDLYTVLWRTFWPALKPVERKIVVLLLMTNGVDDVGRPIEIKDLPVELEVKDEMPRWGDISPAVEAEFGSIVAIHNRRLVTASQVLDRWEALDRSRRLGSLLRSQAFVDHVFDATLGLRPELVSEAVKGAYMTAGVCEADAAEIGATLAWQLDDLLVEHELALWDDISGS
jgi:hypothetical protein